MIALPMTSVTSRGQYERYPSLLHSGLANPSRWSNGRRLMYRHAEPAQGLGELG